MTEEQVRDRLPELRVHFANWAFAGCGISQIISSRVSGLVWRHCQENALLATFVHNRPEETLANLLSTTKALGDFRRQQVLAVAAHPIPGKRLVFLECWPLLVSAPTDYEERLVVRLDERGGAFWLDNFNLEDWLKDPREANRAKELQCHR